MAQKLVALIFVMLIVVAAAKSSAEEKSDSTPAAATSDRVDWRQLDDEALKYFRKYLQFDTSNPPGDTTAAIAYIKSILEHDGIKARTFTSKKGKVSMVAKLPAAEGSGKPFLMMSHVDVVPAVAAQWSHPPFSADVADGFVWARGAQDDKGHGIMALMTMLAMKRNHIALNRPLEMMINADEEVGGELGAGWMVENHFDEIDPAFAVNEGGSGVNDWLVPGVTFRVATAEKRVMWMRFTAHGKAGHGSMPNPENPNLILINALARLLASDPTIRLTPIVDQAMKTVSTRLTGDQAYALAHLDSPDSLAAALRGPLADYMIQAVLRDTIAPTMLNSGVKVNVIPSEAEASIDSRLLPGTDAEAFLSHMRALMADDRITIEFIQRPDDAPPSPSDGEAWNAIAAVVESDFPGALMVPWMTSGGTDSRYLRLKNVPSYGFEPIVADRQEFTRVHGVDERLSIENLNRGIKATYDLAYRLCAQPAR